MATPLTTSKGKLEVKVLASGTNNPGYTEPLGYTDLNLAHGDSSMQAVAVGLNNFARGVVNTLTNRSVDMVKLTYEFDMDNIIDQWDEVNRDV